MKEMLVFRNPILLRKKGSSRERRLCNLMMESGDILFDLSDMSNSYSDMQNPPFDEREVEQAGTSGGIRPTDDHLAGPSSTSTILAGLVNVK